jgi:hypothetical protein
LQLGAKPAIKKHQKAKPLQFDENTFANPWVPLEARRIVEPVAGVSK